MKTRTLALVAGVALAVGASAAGASTPLPNAVGTVHCSVKGSVKYVPPLVSGGTSPVTITLATTEFGCTGTGDGSNITGGSSKTVRTAPTNDCASVLLAPFTPTSGALKWKVVTGTQKWATSTISFTAGSGSPPGTDPIYTDESGSSTAGSFNGNTATAHAVIKSTLAKITAACGATDPKKQLKSLSINPIGSTFDLS